MSNREPAQGRGRVPLPLVVAAVFGGIHAGFTFYWSIGGTWLLSSLGTDLLERFDGQEWTLALVGVVKLVGALLPAALAGAGWPARVFTRGLCWLGAIGLILWGGMNTVIGNLVLTGLIKSDSGYDHAGMVGHALLWDPIFLAWGVALALGLLASRSRTITQNQQG